MSLVGPACRAGPCRIMNPGLQKRSRPADGTYRHAQHALRGEWINFLRVDAKVTNRVGDFPAIELMVVGQPGERGGRDAFGIDLEKPSQGLPGFATAKAVGPEHV